MLVALATAALAEKQPPGDINSLLQHRPAHVMHVPTSVAHKDDQVVSGGILPAASERLPPDWVRRVAVVLHGHYYRRQMMQHTGKMGCSNYFLHADHIDKYLVTPLVARNITVDTYFHTYQPT